MSGAICIGCKTSIQNKDFMCCQTCKQKFDLQCAGLSPKRFKSFSQEKKNKWSCPECICKRPKPNTDNTPVRSSRAASPTKTVVPTPLEDPTTSSAHVTVRKRSPAVSGSYITEEKLRELWRDEMRKDMKSVIDSSVRELSDQLKTINGKCTDFQDTLSYVTQQYDNLQKEIEDLKKLFGNTSSEIKGLKDENKNLKQSLAACVSRVKVLEDEYLKQQQWALIQNIEITGIPESKDEVTTALVIKVTEHIGVPLQPVDIEFAHRVQPRSSGNISQVRPIVVRLRQRMSKDQVIAAARKYRNMTTRDLGIGGEGHKIYINEHLTKENKMLLSSCKRQAKEVNYKYIWTKNCRIYARKNDTSPALLIGSSADLAKVV